MASHPSSSTSSQLSNPFADSPSAATIAMINIRAHVPVVLSMEDSNFGQWRTFFNLTFDKFGLQSHIDVTLDAILMRHDPEWLQIDASIVSWLYTSIDRSLMDAVYKPRNSAYDVWTAICNHFLNNSLSRAVLYQQEFHSLYQGDMSVDEYCGRMKKLANKLHDVGAAVSDPTLVINTLRGLNPKFQTALSVLSAATPPPTFQDMQTFLQQQESYMAHRDKMEAATALMATAPTGSSTNAPKPAPFSPSSTPSSSGGGGGDRRKKRKSNDSRSRNGPNTGTNSNNSASAGQQQNQWAPVIHPWTGVVQAWQLPQAWRPPQAGVLGARPCPPVPQAMTALQAPSFYGTNTGAAVPPPLYNALHGMSAQQPYGGDGGSNWILDTGASTHMANTPGSTHQDNSSPM